MSGIRKSPEIPRSVPKLEAELIRDAYETARRNGGNAGDDANSTDLSEAEQRDFRRRILDIGVSSETLSELGFDADE